MEKEKLNTAQDKLTDMPEWFKENYSIDDYWIVIHPQSKTVLAMFKNEEWAKEWRDGHCTIAKIQKYKLVIR